MFRAFNFMSGCRFALAVLLAASSIACLSAPVPQPLVLNDATAMVDVWPVVTILPDPDAKLTIQDVLAAAEKFTVPQSAYATLGLQQKVVWLRAPVKVAASALAEKQRWILDIDYSLLDRIDVYVVNDGRVDQHAVVGNAPRGAELDSQSLIHSRSQTVTLTLQSGVDYTLILRVDTVGAKILPITLASFSSFHKRALSEQMLQGMLTSLGIGLLLYSLLQWLSVRENIYLKYALLTLGSVLFSMHFFGIGKLYVWLDNIWIEKHMAGFAALIASSGAALFVEDVLREDMHRRLRQAAKILAAMLALTAFAYALDLIGVHVVRFVTGTLGLLPGLLGIPGAIMRIKRGESVGYYFLLAWIGYFVAGTVMVGVVKGNIDANFWTLHAFQFGATFDMLVFMRIAALRSAAVHLAAQRATREHATLHSLAHTDPLTKLLNRRGLNTTLTAALHNVTPEKILALYMLDLDGFKLVNDQFGHDVGDELLEIVAGRLHATMRAGDGIARLGGDEFVVVAGGLHSDAEARELGLKLLAAINAPYALSKHSCGVGVTIGYALAPFDGDQADTLLRLADAAMYSGKQSGRNCLQRSTRLIAR